MIDLPPVSVNCFWRSSSTLSEHVAETLKGCGRPSCYMRCWVWVSESRRAPARRCPLARPARHRIVTGQQTAGPAWTCPPPTSSWRQPCNFGVEIDWRSHRVRSSSRLHLRARNYRRRKLSLGLFSGALKNGLHTTQNVHLTVSIVADLGLALPISLSSAAHTKIYEIRFKYTFSTAGYVLHQHIYTYQVYFRQ